jgi:hypothetical protein
VEAAFDEPGDHRAPRYCEGHGHALRLACRQAPQPGDELGQPGALMVPAPFTQAASVAVAPIDLLLL